MDCDLHLPRFSRLSYKRAQSRPLTVLPLIISCGCKTPVCRSFTVAHLGQVGGTLSPLQINVSADTDSEFQIPNPQTEHICRLCTRMIGCQSRALVALLACASLHAAIPNSRGMHGQSGYRTGHQSQSRSRAHEVRRSTLCYHSTSFFGLFPFLYPLVDDRSSLALGAIRSNCKVAANAYCCDDLWILKPFPAFNHHVPRAHGLTLCGIPSFPHWTTDS